ncbi:ATP-dependent RNA helicase DDX42-like protein [Sarcoptes scabiei]|uniref:RNA helicase n=1 Tax=Sarcoptes scabiei TaxID=52283 RepID=A0A132AD23_SARSC|nr:ATP-dependent RNA helicase DDX42-like protein [Sarcoptes scabiei]
MSSKDFHSVPPPKNLNARQLYTRTDDIHYDINSYCTSSSSSNKSNEKSSSSKGVRQDIEDEDLEESYYKYMESNPNAGIGTMPDDSEEIEYDDDGNPIGMVKKMIDPLPMIYHSEIEYLPFEKNFYTQHEDITKLTTSECVELRHKLGIKVSGANPPKPCSSFAHFGFDEKLMKVVRKCEFSSPTPIQAQGIPAALSGRDVIGIAKTGSGKTAAYLWPMLVHIQDQPELKYGEGPIGLILVPTRELSQQIYQEAKKFAKPFGIHVLCAYGGGSKYDQSKDLEQGADIIVATPGRLIDFIKMKTINLLRVTFLVLDEADRMFDMGFEPQVRSICNHVRPDRQTLIFSATLKKRIEKLIRDVLNDPIRIIQGDLGEANQDITQIVKVFKAGTSQKWDWLIENLVGFTSQGSVLIFVTKKINAQELHQNLEAKSDFKPLLLHGDMNQLDRNKVIVSFKRQESKVLVATDVAARGLDISHIRTVINYDMALDIDTHIHRIGRTGRAGEQGVAYTLVTEKDTEKLGHLIRNLESANQDVPEELMKLAMNSQWFRNSRFKSNPAKSITKYGLGFSESKRRTGFGYQSSSSTTTTTTSSSNETSEGVHERNSDKTSGKDKPSNETNRNENRISIMRSNFKAQFQSRFTAATDTAWKKNENEPQNKKSRWN